MLPDRYQRFLTAVSALVPQGRLFTDPLHTLAWGTDASFYRLIPKIVVRAGTEAEVAAILKAADRADVPVTFRAAGTSLSGQAVTDSVLIVAGSSWNRYEIIDNGGSIRLQPGVIGGHANRYLAPYGRKIGPDPASINAAMIGGIAANNASGMCCGTSQNSYRTVTGMRILFQPTAPCWTPRDPASRDEFAALPARTCSTRSIPLARDACQHDSGGAASAANTRSRTPPGSVSMPLWTSRTPSTSCCT